MGKRGPKRTPKAILEQRGSWLAKYRDGEPGADGVIPTKPDWLIDEVAVAEWSRVVPLLADMNVLSSIDGTALAMYCDAYADFVSYQQLHQQARTNDLRKVFARLKRQAAEQTMKAAALFGMTPAARTGLNVATPTKTATSKKRFFRGGEK
jgi:P27 family predicted phage terminase small subunit